MKYKIITNGKDFAVEIKECDKWYKVLNVATKPQINHSGVAKKRAWGPYRWNTEEAAEEWVREEYGKSISRVREWRIV